MTEHVHLILRRARRHFFRLTELDDKNYNHHSCTVCENDDLYWEDCCVLHDFCFRYHVYVVLQRAQGRLVRQLSHPLKIKSLLTY